MGKCNAAGNGGFLPRTWNVLALAAWSEWSCQAELRCLPQRCGHECFGPLSTHPTHMSPPPVPAIPARAEGSGHRWQGRGDGGAARAAAVRHPAGLWRGRPCARVGRRLPCATWHLVSAACRGVGRNSCRASQDAGMYPSQAVMRRGQKQARMQRGVASGQALWSSWRVSAQAMGGLHQGIGACSPHSTPPPWAPPMQGCAREHAGPALL